MSIAIEFHRTSHRKFSKVNSKQLNNGEDKMIQNKIYKIPNNCHKDKCTKCYIELKIDNDDDLMIKTATDEFYIMKKNIEAFKQLLEN